jgi:hypothetical protein
MKIFVAGATGAVGLPLVRALCTRGSRGYGHPSVALPLTELLANISRGGVASIPKPPNLILQRLNGGGRSSRRLAGRLPSALRTRHQLPPPDQSKRGGLRLTCSCCRAAIETALDPKGHGRSFWKNARTWRRLNGVRPLGPLHQRRVLGRPTSQYPDRSSKLTA